MGLDAILMFEEKNLNYNFLFNKLFVKKNVKAHKTTYKIKQNFLKHRKVFGIL